MERSGVGGGVGHPIGLSDSERADPKAVPIQSLLSFQDEDPADRRTGLCQVSRIERTELTKFEALGPFGSEQLDRLPTSAIVCSRAEARDGRSRDLHIFLPESAPLSSVGKSHRELP